MTRKVIFRKRLNPSKTKMTWPLSSAMIYLSLAPNFAESLSCYRKIASLIVKEGIAVAVTDGALRRRNALALLPPKFNKADVKKLAMLTNLLGKLKE